MGFADEGSLFGSGVSLYDFLILLLAEGVEGSSVAFLFESVTESV